MGVLKIGLAPEFGTGKTDVSQKTRFGKACVLLKNTAPKIECLIEAYSIKIQRALEARVGYLYRLLYRP